MLDSPNVGLGAEDIDRAIAVALTPETVHTVTTWAEENVVLSSASSAEPGPYRIDRTPYCREIQDCLSPTNTAQRVTFIKGTQIGGSQSAFNAIGFYIAHSPCPILYIQKTVEAVKRVSKQRIAPMIADSPSLRSLVRDPRSRDSGNTTLQKDFPGGTLVLTGANSAVGLRSMAARLLIADEIDTYDAEAEDEGDPIKLAERRAQTFGHRRKVFLISTPTIRGRSRIEAEYEASDQRMYHVSCPHCHARQTLKFPNLRWEWGKPETVVYVCEANGCIIQESSKEWMFAEASEEHPHGARWVAKYPDRPNVGFHLSSLYSPPGWMSWREIASEWEDAVLEQRAGKIEKMKTFVNTILAETWEEKGDAPDANRIYERREYWPINIVPMGGLILTAGVDVQKDRLEASVWAWGDNAESWLIDHRVYLGDTSRKEVWTRLVDMLREQWDHEGGASMSLMAMAIDTGYATNEAYDFIRRTGDSRLMAVKGFERGAGMVGSPSPVDITVSGRTIKNGLRLWPVHTSPIKFETYGWLRQDMPEDGAEFPGGYIHLNRQTSLDYCKQLCAEAASTKRVQGSVRVVWEMIQERNEALDCRVYARAAVHVLGWDRFSRHHFDQLRSGLGIREGLPNAPAQAQINQQPQPRGRRVRSKGI